MPGVMLGRKEMMKPRTLFKRTHRLCLVLSEFEYRMLQELVADARRTRSEVVRELIRQEYARTKEVAVI